MPLQNEPNDPVLPQAAAEWFRAPNAAERRLATGLFVGFGLFFLAMFFVLDGWWFRWVVLMLGGYSILTGINHFRRVR